MSGITLRACSKKNEEKPLRFDRVVSEQNILEGSPWNEGNSLWEFLLTDRKLGVKDRTHGSKNSRIDEEVTRSSFLWYPVSMMFLGSRRSRSFIKLR